MIKREFLNMDGNKVLFSIKNIPLIIKKLQINTKILTFF